jgi:Gnt-I system high-affinity gluconate transporter
MSLIIVTGCIVLLLVMILLKLNPFLALLIVSTVAGVALGIAPDAVVKSIQKGVGDTLGGTGGLALVLGLGAMFGKMIEVSGAARQISETLVRKFGKERLPWAMVLTGLVVGIPLFYNAGFVILVPLVFSVARTSNVPLLWVAIPMASSLSVTHGFLPPHPGPTAIAAIFKADLGRTLLYGFAIGIPISIVAGPFFARFMKKIKAPVLPASTTVLSNEKLPSVALSFGLAIFPVFLISFATMGTSFLGFRSPVVNLIGEPVFALLLALLIACYFLGIARGLSIGEIMNHLTASVAAIAMIMMVIGAGGGFKEVLISSGVAKEVAARAAELSLSPLVLGWLVAAIVRLSIGSATVAGLTAAGIVSGIAQGPGANPELMVLSVGAGSLFCSHVNDTGFWMFKEYFNLSLKQTFLSWSMMETIVSTLGLAGVLILEKIIG